LLSRLFVSFLQSKRDAFQAKSLLFRTLVVTGVLVTGSAVFIGGISFAAVSATQAVFHTPEAEASANSPVKDEEGLAAGSDPVREKPAASAPTGKKVARSPGATAKKAGERAARGDTSE
jgi:hypothetical protein